MIDRAVSELELDPRLSVMVGDQLIDMELASAVGARGILLDAEGKFCKRDTIETFSIVANLDQAAKSRFRCTRPEDPVILFKQARRGAAADLEPVPPDGLVGRRIDGEAET